MEVSGVLRFAPSHPPERRGNWKVAESHVPLYLYLCTLLCCYFLFLTLPLIVFSVSPQHHHNHGTPSLGNTARKSEEGKKQRTTAVVHPPATTRPVRHLPPSHPLHVRTIANPSISTSTFPPVERTTARTSLLPSLNQAPPQDRSHEPEHKHDPDSNPDHTRHTHRHRPTCFRATPDWDAHPQLDVLFPLKCRDCPVEFQPFTKLHHHSGVPGSSSPLPEQLPWSSSPSPEVPLFSGIGLETGNCQLTASIFPSV
jgi:hypothetical protein